MSIATCYLKEETLSCGSKVTIRAMRPDDKHRLIKAFFKLKPHTVRMRFFYSKKDLSESDLNWLAQMDYVSDVGLVAALGSGSDEVIVGEGRYVALGRTAEVAFTVDDDWQGRGIAGRLLQHLARIARSHAVVQFEADVLKENSAMLRVFQHSGFPMTTRAGDEEIRVMLRLSDESLAPPRIPDGTATIC